MTVGILFAPASIPSINGFILEGNLSGSAGPVTWPWFANTGLYILSFGLYEIYDGCLWDKGTGGCPTSISQYV